MAKYELSDAQVDRLLGLLNMSGNLPEDIALNKSLVEQKPVPLPTKLLGLIEDENAMQYCLLHPADGTGWFGPTNHQVNLGSWRSLDQLPKDFNVLFEGVNL